MCVFVCLFVCFETPVTEIEVLNSFTTQCRVITPSGLVAGGSRDLKYHENTCCYVGIKNWGLRGSPALAEPRDAEDFSGLCSILFSAGKQAKPS